MLRALPAALTVTLRGPASVAWQTGNPLHSPSRAPLPCDEPTRGRDAIASPTASHTHPHAASSLQSAPAGRISAARSRAPAILPATEPRPRDAVCLPLRHESPVSVLRSG